MRDGDVYRWRFTDDELEKRGGAGPYKAYHCRSRIAIARNGVLYDTYWGDTSDDRVIGPENIVLELQGNLYDMTPISKYDLMYYRPEDIVDMRHSNSFSAKIYVQPGAKRDAETMRRYAQDKITEARRKIESAIHDVERYGGDLKMIELGCLDQVHF